MINSEEQIQRAGVAREEVVAAFASVNETAGQEEDRLQQHNDEFASCRSRRAMSQDSISPKCRELCKTMQRRVSGAFGASSSLPTNHLMDD